MGSLPADLTCPQCATAIADDSVVLLREGELFHLQCRGQTLSLEAMDAVLRVRRAWSYSAKRTARAMGRRLERSGTVRTGRCPLCEAAATLGDAGGEWTAVKGCPCDGFFIWNPLVLHLSRLLESRRATVTEAVRDLRRQGREAWLRTRDGMLAGALVVLPWPSAMRLHEIERRPRPTAAEGAEAEGQDMATDATAASNAAATTAPFDLRSFGRSIVPRDGLA